MTEELKRRIVAAAPKEWGWYTIPCVRPIINYRDDEHSLFSDADIAMRLLEDMKECIRECYWDSDGRHNAGGIPQWAVRLAGDCFSPFCDADLATAIAEAWLRLREKKCRHCGKVLESDD